MRENNTVKNADCDKSSLFNAPFAKQSGHAGFCFCLGFAVLSMAALKLQILLEMENDMGIEDWFSIGL